MARFVTFEIYGLNRKKYGILLYFKTRPSEFKTSCFSPNSKLKSAVMSVYGWHKRTCLLKRVWLCLFSVRVSENNDFLFLDLLYSCWIRSYTNIKKDKPISSDNLRRGRMNNNDNYHNFFYVLLTVHLRIILAIDQLNAQILVLQ